LLNRALLVSVLKKANRLLNERGRRILDTSAWGWTSNPKDAERACADNEALAICKRALEEPEPEKDCDHILGPTTVVGNDGSEVVFSNFIFTANKEIRFCPKCGKDLR